MWQYFATYVVSQPVSGRVKFGWQQGQSQVVCVCRDRAAQAGAGERAVWQYFATSVVSQPVSGVVKLRW